MVRLCTRYFLLYSFGLPWLDGQAELTWVVIKHQIM